MVLSATALLLAWSVWLFIRRRLRENSLFRLLDLADEMEALLAQSQAKLSAMRTLIERAPEDIALRTRSFMDVGIPVQNAKRDLLQHRLWIQQNGMEASQSQLNMACDALQKARDTLLHQLTELEHAAMEFAAVTDAAWKAADNEPASLRRKH